MKPRLQMKLQPHSRQVFSLFFSTLKSSFAHRGSSQIRIILNQDGVLTASATKVDSFQSDPTGASFSKPDLDTKSLYGPLFTIYLDSQPSPTSIFTYTKTTQRSTYDDARARKNIAGPTVLVDVLLYNLQGMITETSLSNVAVYRNGQWFTPHSSTGCLPGVLRRWLLEQGRIREDTAQRLTKDSIQDGDWILLLNGVHGCRLGRVCL
ncbi:hypothetical protein HGRIS_008325 [Hohenbuehelia grisea]|uniref:Aminodeoxychorismate lyase n=1 Tax=Hohenbuehelia grisea TaxID=104357 RepID=A0ABR3J826_9AGAR